GALRAAGVLDDIPDGVDADDWFMDYRNADGSIAEMCGNGVRVFAHYLATRGWETRSSYVVGSRAGARPVTLHHTDEFRADVTVDMGVVRDLGTSTVTVAGRVFTGLGVDVGNPHLACVEPKLTSVDLAELDLSAAPGFDPSVFPHGVNIEILTPMHEGGVDMRVHERGVGETRSCGTGTVAAAAAALRHAGAPGGDGQVDVRVPGGQVCVRIDEGRAFLRGPSVLVADGRIDPRWWDDLG
ncbi:MAG: diaminopimelate epimerase, partial [Aldersonia sp.]|nr:diaminopimelate epimerase [Aldersonia sp.]